MDSTCLFYKTSTPNYCCGCIFHRRRRDGDNWQAKLRPLLSCRPRRVWGYYWESSWKLVVWYLRRWRNGLRAWMRGQNNGRSVAGMRCFPWQRGVPPYRHKNGRSVRKTLRHHLWSESLLASYIYCGPYCCALKYNWTSVERRLHLISPIISKNALRSVDQMEVDGTGLLIKQFLPPFKIDQMCILCSVCR